MRNRKHYIEGFGRRGLRRFEGRGPVHKPEAQPGGDPHRRREHRHEHHGRRAGRRNFWSEWRRELHRHHGGDLPYGRALSPKEVAEWRAFFHETFGAWPEDHWVFGGRRFSPWHQGIDTFNPFVASLLSKGGGLLPLYVLHLIAQQPRYGNEIMDILEERTNGQWAPNPGAIYPLLALLEDEEFIEGQWEDPEKRTVRIYTITEKGREEVARIAMIVMPKLTETLDVLQALINDLQPAGGEPDDGDTAGETGADSI